MAILAIALVAALGSQTQSVSLAGEAKFATTAVYLAQSKMATFQTMASEDLTSDSGDFGDDFPGYRWQAAVEDVTLGEGDKISDHLKKVDLTVSWGDQKQYQYGLTSLRFVAGPQ